MAHKKSSPSARENNPNLANSGGVPEKEQNDGGHVVDDGDNSQIVSPAERKRIRKGYRHLMNAVITWDPLSAGDQIDEGDFQKAMKTTDKLFTQVDTPQEALLDAKVFKHLTILTRNQVEGLSTSTQNFTPLDFADRLISFMIDNYNPGDNGQGGANDGVALSPKHFSGLGLSIQHYIPVVPHLQYFIGSFDYNMNIDSERKAKQPKAIKDRGPVNATQTYIDDGSNERPQSGAALTELLVESTFKQLVADWRSNGRQPICYFRFVLDPDSFGRSVENIFHVAFLIKDAKAKISVNNDVNALPKLEPVRKKEQNQRNRNGENDDDDSGRQVIVNIDLGEWEILVKNLTIKKAAIDHGHLKLRARNANEDATADPKRCRRS